MGWGGSYGSVSYCLFGAGSSLRDPSLHSGARVTVKRAVGREGLKNAKGLCLLLEPNHVASDHQDSCDPGKMCGTFTALGLLRCGVPEASP